MLSSSSRCTARRRASVDNMATKGILDDGHSDSTGEFGPP